MQHYGLIRKKQGNKTGTSTRSGTKHKGALVFAEQKQEQSGTTDEPPKGAESDKVESQKHEPEQRSVAAHKKWKHSKQKEL